MLHTYHRSISLEFFKQCCNHSLTCFGNHKNKCCYIHNNVTNINKISMGAFLWKSTRQILVISITTSQTCPGGCYIHNNITNSNKTKSCYIHNNVTNTSSSIIQKYRQLTSGASLLTTPCIPKISKNLMQHYPKILTTYQWRISLDTPCNPKRSTN